VSGEVLDFYNQMTDDYHLILTDWDSAVRSQASSIKKLIQKHISDTNTLSILDCSCGIGTQAIGLALEGYKVTGTDISPKEIERAKKEAKRLGASVSFHVANFQKLEETLTDKYDIILSFDNAVAHLKDVGELQSAFTAMRKSLKPNGAILISVRNNDELRAQKPCGTLPRVIEDQFGKRIIVQTWGWNNAGDAYDLTMFILQKKRNEWRSQSYPSVPMRAFNQEEINQVLKLSGAIDIKWFSTPESGYYQPVVMAKFREQPTQ